MSVNEAYREALEVIGERCGEAYCYSLHIAIATPCLGWEAKVKCGEFGAEEMDAHKRSNIEMGRHQGLAEAAKIIRAAIDRAAKKEVE